MSRDTPPPVTAEIVVRRRGDTAAVLRDVRIRVDGAYVGGLRPTQSLVVPVGPGLHEVRARLDWARSPVLTIDTSAGGAHRLVVSFPWSAFWRMLWAPGSALTITLDTRPVGAMYPR
ncbi:hypothetical protein [Cellulomonas sp. URHE0023]|uniref:hypothetical protein n=1 Tax=Cellulomonas sp. URHE0023 TaxID=1380354 RepID=UPI0004820F5C|nr:hypothetical protein [Cellulomonas sp. URHE0023]